MLPPKTSFRRLVTGLIAGAFIVSLSACSLLAPSSAPPPDTPDGNTPIGTPEAHPVFAQLDSDFTFASGAGGWSTTITIAPDGSFVIAFLTDGRGAFELELTWLKERGLPYNLGDNETHLAFHTDDYAASHALHERMRCICHENPQMGLYFICDPDDYWIEILGR